MDWEQFAWLKRGPRRRSVLEVINNSNVPVTVNDVQGKLKIAMPQASVTVKELLEKGFIVCLNEDDKIGKLYKITDSGRKILNELR